MTLVFWEDGCGAATRPLDISEALKRDLEAEVEAYNTQIAALSRGAADPSSYKDADDRIALAAVARGEGHGRTGALFPRWCYEKWSESFELVELDPNGTAYDEDTALGDCAFLSDSELAHTLTSLYDSWSEFMLGFRILPATASAFGFTPPPN